MKTRPQKTPRILTISGEICTGTTSVTSGLAKALNWRHVSTGAIFRQYCKDNGFDVLDISRLPDHIHRSYDEFVRSLMGKEDNYIFEGRLCGWFAQGMKGAFRVFLSASLEVRIGRYVARESTSFDDAQEKLLGRDLRDFEKFRSLYGLRDYRDPKYYDLVLDTSSRSVAETVEEILAAMTAKTKG